MALVSINIEQEFVDESLSQEEDYQKNPIPINSQNIKNGITKYKMKLKEKKKFEQNSEKNSKNLNVINSKGKWWSENETDENQEYVNHKSEKQKKGEFELKINIQNMKIKKENNNIGLRNQNQEKINYFNSNSSSITNQIFNRTSTIKGNLFKNTTKSVKANAEKDNEKYNSKNYNFTYNEKEYANIVNSDFTKKANVDNINFNNNINNENISKFNCNFDNSSLDQRVESKNDINIVDTKELNSLKYRNVKSREDLIPQHVKNLNPKSFVEFNHKNQEPSTIYNVLNKRKKEFFQNINYQNQRNAILEPTKELLFQKKNYLRTNNLTSLLEQKKKDFIPYIFDVARIHQNSFENISEKNRYVKLTDLFLKLRVYLNQNPENELVIVKEFFIRHGMYNQEYFSFENISNFISFINSDDCIKFQPSKSLKEIIFDVFRVDYEEYNQQEEHIKEGNNFDKENNEGDNDKINGNEYYDNENHFDDMNGNININEGDNDKNNENVKSEIPNEKVSVCDDNSNKYNADNEMEGDINENLKNENEEKKEIENNNDEINNIYIDNNTKNINETQEFSAYKKSDLLQVTADFYKGNQIENINTIKKKTKLNKENVIYRHSQYNDQNFSSSKKFQQYDNTPYFINRTNSNFFKKNNNNKSKDINKKPKNQTIGKFYKEKNLFVPNNPFNNSKKPMTSQGLKSSKNSLLNSNNNFKNNINNISQESEERNNADNYPILNEKIYKIQFKNTKLLIDNLEPEIAKIKGLSINSPSEKKIRNYEKSLDRKKKSQNFLAKMNTNLNGELNSKDIEQIKKKNKLLEYIVLQRSKNRLKIENDKRIFQLDYSEKKNRKNLMIFKNKNL